MQKFGNEFDWDHARVFLAVAREGQLLGAARKLKLDHATVTRRINALETSLGVRLLERRTTGSALTAAGREFLDYAGRVEAEFLNVKASLTQDAAVVEGTVRVGAPDGFGTLFLASRFGPLLTQHPRLAVQLVPLPRSFSLSKREADIAITVERPGEGRLKVKKLTDYTLSLYASSAYLAASGKLSTKGDLKNHRLIAYVPDLLFTRVLDFSAELGIPAQPQFQCASVLGQIEAVKSGCGIGLLHDYSIAKADSLIRVLPGISVRRSYWIVTHADGAHARPVRAVYDFIVAATAEASPVFVKKP
jgi:DNA-binding transcriptional LysR family regulator